MAILDLQGLETPRRGSAGKSGASKGCGPSGLSLLLC